MRRGIIVRQSDKRSSVKRYLDRCVNFDRHLCTFIVKSIETCIFKTITPWREKKKGGLSHLYKTGKESVRQSDESGDGNGRCDV